MNKEKTLLPKPLKPREALSNDQYKVYYKSLAFQVIEQSMILTSMV